MKTKTLAQLLKADFKQISVVPTMMAKEEKGMVAIYRIKASTVREDIFERVWYSKKKYFKRELGWDEI